MSKYELYIAQLLTREHYRYRQEKTYTDLRGGKYRYDFFLPDVNGGTLIEIDGEQHWKPIHGSAELKKAKAHDRFKNSYALAHEIPLYRIPYWEISAIQSIDDIMSENHRVKSKYHNDDLTPP